MCGLNRLSMARWSQKKIDYFQIHISKVVNFSEFGKLVVYVTVCNLLV